MECYHCEKQIGDWLVQKDPWVEHVKKSPNCFHVMLVKGPEFGRAVASEVKNTELKNKLFKEMPFANQQPEEESPAAADVPVDNTEGTTIIKLPFYVYMSM